MAHSHLYCEAIKVDGHEVIFRYSKIAIVVEQPDPLHSLVILDNGERLLLQYEYRKLRHHLRDHSGIYDLNEVEWDGE